MPLIFIESKIKELREELRILDINNQENTSKFRAKQKELDLLIRVRIETKELLEIFFKKCSDTFY